MNRSTIAALALTTLSYAGVYAQTARVQVIHNCPNPVANEVDIYINGAKPEALDNFAFRTATPFVDLPAGQDITITVALPTSTGVTDGVVANIPIGQLEDGGTYVVMAIGANILPTDAFTAPEGRDIGFRLLPIGGQESAEAGSVALNIVHGSTDAPAVDVYLGAESISPAVLNLDFGQSTDYITVPTGKYPVLLAPAGAEPVPGLSYYADLTSLGGGAAIVFASGFLDASAQPGSPENRDFGLYVATPDGEVSRLPGLAGLNVIHNSPLSIASTVDVYVNGEKPESLDNFFFRSNSNTLFVPAETPLTVAIAGPSSQSAAEALLTYEVPGLAQGALTFATVSGNSADPTSPTRVQLYPNQMPIAADDKVVVSVFHGVTDAPAVDVYAEGVAEPLVSGLSYGEYSNALSVDPANYTFVVTVAGNPDAVVGRYRADLTTAGGSVFVVAASGFLDITDEVPPASLANRFGLWAFNDEGVYIKLPEVPSQVRVQIVHNCPDPLAASVDVYVNGQKPEALDDFSFRTATPYLSLEPGTPTEVKVAGPTSSGPDDQVVATINLPGLEAGDYILSATGLVGTGFNTPEGRDVSFSLTPMTGEAFNGEPQKISTVVSHGSPDAPAVDIYLAPNTDGAPTIPNVDFRESTSLLSLEPGEYPLLITATGSKDVAASFEADLSTLGGRALSIHASGFLGDQPGGGNNFALLLVFEDGSTAVLEQVATSVEENTVQTTPSAKLYPVPASAQTTLAFESPVTQATTVEVISLHGAALFTITMPQGSSTVNIPVANLTNGTYFVRANGKVMPLVVSR